MLLHYQLLTEFKQKYYKDLLTLEHVVGGQTRIDKLSFPDGTKDDSANFWGYVLEKDGVKYLISSVQTIAGEKREVSLKQLLPCYARDLVKVANRDVVYYWIKKPVTAKIRPVKHFNFRTLVDKLCSISHSNAPHQRLYWLIGLCSYLDRANFRVSTPAGFGKDSVVDTIQGLVGGCYTITNPTLAKLAFATQYKWVAINEVVGVTKEKWRDIEQFLLDAGAFKQTILKHSRAVDKVREELDISKLSLSLFYNDIDCYERHDHYFDDIIKSAVKDRFIPLRFHGRYTADFSEVSKLDIPKFVSEHLEEYKQIVGTLEYYKTNTMIELKGFNHNRLMSSMPQRWAQNVSCLLKYVDLDSATQEEFDTKVDIINSALEEYHTMLGYPHAIESWYKQTGIPSYVYKDMWTPQSILKWLRENNKTGKWTKHISFLERLLKEPTFKVRITLLRGYTHDETKEEQHSFW